MQAASASHTVRHHIPATRLTTAPEKIERLLAQAGIGRDEFSVAVAKDSATSALPPPRPPVTLIDEQIAGGARSFVAQLETMQAGNASLDVLNADMLLATFLKLNINDPNNSVETQNELHELSSNLREMALQEAQKRQEVATEMAREAEDAGGYAAMAMQISVIVSVAGIFTGGVVSMIAAVVSGVAQAAKAAEDLDVTEKMLDAQEMGQLAERSRNHAQRHQEQIEGEAENIRDLFEYKNTVVDNVLQMMDQAHTTRNRVMSVAFAY